MTIKQKSMESILTERKEKLIFKIYFAAQIFTYSELVCMFQPTDFHSILTTAFCFEDTEQILWRSIPLVP